MLAEMPQLLPDVLRRAITAVDGAVERRGVTVPSRPVTRFVQEGGAVSLDVVGVEPAFDVALGLVYPDLIDGEEFKALAAALAATAGEDAEQIDASAAARAIVRHHVAAHGMSTAADALDESVAVFRAFLAHDTITTRFVGTLDNFESAEEDVRLAEDVCLHRVTVGDLDRLWKERGETFERLHHWAIGLFGSLTHLLYVEQQVGRFGQSGNARPLQDRVAATIRALRLHRAGSVQSSFQWFEHLPPVAEFAGCLHPMLMGGTLFVPTIPRRETYEFTDLDIEPVADLLGKVDRFGRAGRAVDLAVRRFEGSYARGPEEDRMIDAWVALEALSAPETSTELRYRASNRIARLIGPDTAARVELQSFLRLSYDVRSHLVHGGDPEKFRREVQKKVDGLGGLDAVVSETTDVLRRVLRAWLDDPRSPETVVQDLDAQMMA